MYRVSDFEWPVSTLVANRKKSSSRLEVCSPLALLSGRCSQAGSVMMLSLPSCLRCALGRVGGSTALSQEALCNKQHNGG